MHFEINIVNNSQKKMITVLLLTCGLSRAADTAPPPGITERGVLLVEKICWEEVGRLSSPE